MDNAAAKIGKKLNAFLTSFKALKVWEILKKKKKKKAWDGFNTN